MSTRHLVGCSALLVSLAASPAAVPDGLAGQEPVAAQAPWTRIAAETPTECAFGTPYSFFHREGTDPGRLLIYFQGGGACWESLSCSGMFDPTVEHTEPFAFRGVFDRAEPRNPLRAFSVVFVPYCTGDVHIGDASVSYGDGTRSIGHRGFRNVTAVLEWIGSRGFRPSTVVVAGTSAGAYGALFYMRPVARLFPDARLVLLGDSGVPLLHGNEKVLQTWGAGSVMATLWRDEHAPRTLLEAYRQAALIGPRVRLTQITSDRDGVQGAFYLISGSPDWRRVTYALLTDVKTAVPAFRSFIVAGSDHGLLPVDAFYSYRSDGVVLHEWVGRLIAGESVEDVRCAGCVP